MSRETLREIDHTHPYTGRPFGDTQAYGRGRIAADGGTAAESDPESMATVTHTPPNGSIGAQRAYDRGYENR